MTVVVSLSLGIDVCEIELGSGAHFPTVDAVWFGETTQEQGDPDSDHVRNGPTSTG